MNTMNAALTTTSRRPSPSKTPQAFRRPNFDCRDLPAELRLVIYVPGTAASGVEIEARGPDLTVTAHKNHFVRLNWTALHLEAVQQDYRLKLRLGHGFAYPDMKAEIGDGILTLTIPKRNAAGLGARQAA
jgi:HSP20 family protein